MPHGQPTSAWSATAFSPVFGESAGLRIGAWMHSGSVHWEIIADNLKKAGWRCGCITTTDGKGRPILVVAAERSDVRRLRP